MKKERQSGYSKEVNNCKSWNWEAATQARAAAEPNGAKIKENRQFAIVLRGAGSASTFCVWVGVYRGLLFIWEGCPLQCLKEYASLQRLTMHLLDYP